MAGTDVSKDVTRRYEDFLSTMDEGQRREWIKDIIDRMILAWDLKSKRQLADKLTLHHKAPSNWIQNSTVPWSAIFVCSHDTGKTLDWLYYGKEPHCLLADDAANELYTKLAELLRLSCKTKLIKEANDNGLNTLADALVDEVREFYAQRGELGHDKQSSIKQPK